MLTPGPPNRQENQPPLFIRHYRLRTASHLLPNHAFTLSLTIGTKNEPAIGVLNTGSGISFISRRNLIRYRLLTNPVSDSLISLVSRQTVVLCKTCIVSVNIMNYELRGPCEVIKHFLFDILLGTG